MTDLLESLAAEVLGDGATLETMDFAGVLTVHVTAGEGKARTSRAVVVRSGPTAERAAREQLLRVLLAEQRRRRGRRA